MKTEISSKTHWKLPCCGSKEAIKYNESTSTGMVDFDVSIGKVDFKFVVKTDHQCHLFNFGACPNSIKYKSHT